MSTQSIGSCIDFVGDGIWIAGGAGAIVRAIKNSTAAVTKSYGPLPYMFYGGGLLANTK